MKAHILSALMTPLVIEELPDVEPAADSVVIKLQAAALNRRDYWITQGRYPNIQFPCVLGSDGVGKVVKTGSGVEQDFGDEEVIINPGWDWGNRQEAQSEEFTILGLPHHGTFAEYIHIPAKYVHPKPAYLTTQQAAALPLAGVTAYRGMFSRGQMRSEETVLITGIGGGVATFALQYATAIGATAVVTSSSPTKIDQAKKMGAQEGFLYTDPNWPQLFQEKFGAADLIFDGAGGPGYARLIEVAAPGGRIVNYGGTGGAPDKLDIFRVYWKQLNLLGSTMGSEKDFAAMLKFVEQHQIAPVIDQVFEFSNLNSAIERISDSAQFGKILLQISEG
jgi:zinc-binding alcohol dehydrogenase/oxidoreductase